MVYADLGFECLVTGQGNGNSSELSRAERSTVGMIHDPQKPLKALLALAGLSGRY